VIYRAAGADLIVFIFLPANYLQKNKRNNAAFAKAGNISPEKQNYHFLKYPKSTVTHILVKPKYIDAVNTGYNILIFLDYITAT
jgi:hypothetical protein